MMWHVAIFGGFISRFGQPENFSIVYYCIYGIWKMLVFVDAFLVD